MQIEFNGDAPQRLDVFLASEISFLSRTQLSRMIKECLIKVDDDNAKPSFLLHGGEQIDIEIPAPEPYVIEPENIQIDIAYEEDEFCVAIKPQGMLTHPAGSTITGTLVNAMLYHCQGKLSGMMGVQRPGIVHRLDKDTSGLIIIAKTDYAVKHFAKLFLEHQIDKRYYAICKGYLKCERTIINAPIGRDTSHRWKMSINPDGREAITKVQVIEKLSGHTYIEAKPVTGRTHQIRVHLSYIGHPVLGDPTYGGQSNDMPLPGQLLHCGKLAFEFKGKPYEIVAPLPNIFTQTLVKLRLTEEPTRL